MNIAIIGTGYVGLPTGIGLAELGHKVVCIDKNKEKIKQLNNGNLTLYEQGLDELFVKNLKAKSIQFTTSMAEHIPEADIVLIAVGTPPHPETNEADMRFIYEASSELAMHLNEYTVIATKSTVPVGTGDEVQEIIAKHNPKAQFDVVSLPEFLREGYAVYDFFNPDRIVIGSNCEKATSVVLKMYSKFEDKTQFHIVNRRSSETIKYASNAFLAIKIHYINEIADFCEKTGANIEEVASGMGLDNRIGPKFLNPGPGYGGSCFPKDTLALAQMGEKYNSELNLVTTAINGNKKRKTKLAKKILKVLQDIESPRLAVLGLAFKNGTDDCRESPAIQIINEVLEANPNIEINAYDPKATKNAKILLNGTTNYAADMYEAMTKVDLIVVLTEWEEFKTIDFAKAKESVRSKKILDFRNILNEQEALKNNFDYQSIGSKNEEYTSNRWSRLYRVTHSQRAQTQKI